MVFFFFFFFGGGGGLGLFFFSLSFLISRCFFVVAVSWLLWVFCGGFSIKYGQENLNRNNFYLFSETETVAISRLTAHH